MLKLRKFVQIIFNPKFIRIFQPLVVSIACVLVIVAIAKAGSLTPPGIPASTMQNLSALGNGPKAMSAESSAAYTQGNAAKYCYDLSAAAAVASDGDTTTVRTDWRLPSAPEAVMFEGTITSTNYIWTATVYTSGGSWVSMKLSNGDWTNNTGYNYSNYVRCIR